MTTFILVIAGLHTLPPIIGALTGGKFGLFIGASIGALIAVLVGGGAYTPIDLLGVIVGSFIGYSLSKSKKNE